jgi:hypothetical protein
MKNYLLPWLICFFPFINIIAQEQQWQTRWNTTVTQKDEYTELQLFATDYYNNTFIAANYHDSVFLGDTVFGHNSIALSSANGVIAKYDTYGRFQFALDVIHDTANMFSLPIDQKIAADRENNYYVAIVFMQEIMIQDSVIQDIGELGSSFPERSIAILKLSPDFEIEFVKLISGSPNDVCHGIFVGEDDNLYLHCTHYPYAYQTDTINYFNQDSVVISKSLSSVLKMDKTTGDLIWRESFYSSRNLLLEGNELIHMVDNRFGVFGRFRDTLFVSGDTIIDPYSEGDPDYIGHNFVQIFDSTGAVDDPVIFPWSMYFQDLEIDEFGYYYMAGTIWDTVVFAGDTIYFHDDSTKVLLTKLDQSLNPQWYELVNHNINFELAAIDDNLYFSGRARSNLSLFDTSFSFGGFYRTIIGEVSPQGELTHFMVPDCSRNLRLFELRVDNCNQLLLAGIFDGTVRFENDTVSVHQTGVTEGILVKIQRHPPDDFSLGPDTTVCDSTVLVAPEGYATYYWNNVPSELNRFNVNESGIYTFACVNENGCWVYDTINIQIQPGFTIELGADTTIMMHDTIVLSMPEGFDHYLWSNGDTTNFIQLIGGQLGEGDWDIWAEVTDEVCSDSDSVRITVLSIILEFNQAGINAYPNPVSKHLNINSKTAIKSIECIDLNGETVYRKTFQNTPEFRKSINMASFKKGVYILKITTEKAVATGRIIKI